ncbi:MAG: hypothetical protein WB680_16775, partial [Candidatus Acidiferrales bacterium]
NQSHTPQNDHERGDAKPRKGTKSETLEEADGHGKNKRSRKGKRQRLVVDLLFALIIGMQKAQEEQDGRPGSGDCQSKQD